MIFYGPVVQRLYSKRNMVHVWTPMPKLTITSPYVVSRVDSNTFTMGIGQPYARVDLNPMPKSGTKNLASICM
jgi:hypothetical protein